MKVLRTYISKLHTTILSYFATIIIMKRIDHMIRNGFFCMKFLDPVDMENCERENCMYQHISDNDEEKNEDSDKETDENDDEVDGDYDEDDDEVDEDDGKDETTYNTFCNPSQSDESEADEKKKMKCDLCNFETEDRKRFDRHRFESHSVKGKYACMKCKQHFDNRKEFNFGCC